MPKLIKDITWLLKDTIEFYSKYPNKRAIGDIGCVYSGKNSTNKTSTGCAIGRHMKPSDRLTADECGGVMGVETLINDFPELVPKWIKEIDGWELRQIQILHDGNQYWNSAGISDNGLSFVVDNFKSRVNLDEVLSVEQLNRVVIN